jgi:hypothetical protein
MNAQAGQNIEPNAGIPVDMDAVVRRAYDRIAALTMQNDQWETAYAAQSERLTQIQTELDEVRGRAVGSTLTAVADAR